MRARMGTATAATVILEDCTLWLRGRAQADSYNNDSVYVQFSGSVTAAGAPANRIGSTQAVPRSSVAADLSRSTCFDAIFSC